MSPVAGFERLRPARRTHEVPDAEGKRALFSIPSARPAFGSVVVHCPACEGRTVLSPTQAARAALPSVHLPVVRRGRASWMRCPACGRRGWLNARLSLLTRSRA